MCGRYTVTVDQEELVEVFDAPAPEGLDLGLPRYNLAPTQVGPVVAIGRSGERSLQGFRWGLVPFWADDPSIGNRMINARAESVADKPAWRRAFQRRRCLVPADGFYEWQEPPDGTGTKIPHWIHRPDRRPFALAGLWEMWGEKEDPLLTYTIITTRASADVARYHPRMPAIVPEERWDAWLARDTTLEVLMEILGAPPAGTLHARRVGRQVNTPTHDEPNCIEALPSPPGEGDP